MSGFADQQKLSIFLGLPLLGLSSFFLFFLQYGKALTILSLLLFLMAVVVFVFKRDTLSIFSLNFALLALVLTIFLNSADLFLPFKVSALLEIFLLSGIVWGVYKTGLSSFTGYVPWLLALMFFVALSIAVTSTIVSNWSLTKPALYQFVYFLKWPLMVYAGFLCKWQRSDFSRLHSIIISYVLFCLSFVAFEITFPDIYAAVAKNLVEFRHTSNPLTGGWSTRGTGPFIHSSVLAYFSALLACLLIIGFWADKKHAQDSKIRFPLAVFPLAALVIFSGQQQELMAGVVCCAMGFVGVHSRSALLGMITALVSVASAVALVFFFIGGDQIDSLMYEWGFSDSLQAVTSARPVLFSDSVMLANEYFPLGAGLGTFAGIGAKLFNSDLYESLGYSAYWWYQQDIFLLDTYWPNYFAEFGWLGSAALLSIPFVIVGLSYTRLVYAQTADVAKVWGYALACQTFSLIVSLTSPIYSDPGMVLFPMLIFGAAIRYGHSRSYDVDNVACSSFQEAK